MSSASDPQSNGSTSQVDFYFDPVCPFCWQTSQWMRQASKQRDIAVRWRLISLRFLNEPNGYEGKPPLMREVHQQGTRLLRVAAAVRADHGNEAVGRLYEAMGQALWEADPPGDGSAEAVRTYQSGDLPIEDMLTVAGLPTGLAAAADDESFDAILKEETQEGLDRVGAQVGTPIISFDSPDGPAYFGPVISELPSDDEAAELWDAFKKVASWEGFAEFKGSLRDVPDLPMMAGRRKAPSARR